MILKLKVYKVLFTALTLSVSYNISAQDIQLIDFCGWRPVVISGNLPENLTSTRCAVIVEMDPEAENNSLRPKWKPFASRIHTELRKMYIDPICYIFSEDLKAGPEVRRAYVEALKDRGIKNLIVFERKFAGLEEIYNIKIAEFNEQHDLVSKQESVWVQDEAPFNLIFLRLGRQIIRQNLDRTNFLIPEKPNILDDLPLFDGIQLSSYPGLIRRSKLAVIIPEKYELFQGISPSATEMLQKENLRIEREIQEIESIMGLYPYPYELVPFGSDEDLSRKGFQYALMPFHSTGSIIRKMLNYKVLEAETDFISVIPKDDSGVTLKTIPVNQPVHKYYIKQTISHDIYVGKEWDSDFTRESALLNFIINLKRALQ